jgi:hypothetical protein
MSLSNERLAVENLQPATQQALYRAGRLNLAEQFEPWSELLQIAIQIAALYGLAISEAEAEAAIACLFEINPPSCWQLLCSDFAPAEHAALVRGILCDRYQWLLLGFSADDAVRLTAEFKVLWHQNGRVLSWAEIGSIVMLYLRFR